MIKRNIIVSLQVEGLHSWSECPIPRVSFLRNIHRHIFHIKIEKEVSHNDRDIEIIMFKREVTEYLRKKYFSKKSNTIIFKNKSCEMIAEEILKKFNCVSVEVLEDNENGARIYKG